MSEQPPESVLTEIAVAAAVARTADGLAEEVLDDVRAWLGLWRLGDLTDALLKSRLVESIFTGCDRAFYEAGVLTSQVLDEDAPLIPDLPADVYTDKLTKAVDTLFEDLDVADTDDTEGSVIEFDDDGPDVISTDTEVVLPPRLERLATAEPTAALQDGMVAAYAERGAIGYRRGLDADPCQLCGVYLYRGGKVWPIDKPMHKHPGCQCYPIPVFEGDSEND